ncbi:MAG: copper resistance protein NlpE N-terminal domain-containing protein [Bacteroidales bacterium]|nr:copper resistance protein NlpE N-terminal domain-containing protein [Bacteroidales bacterium]MBN2748570.1 copper resistance protein NlpE N-terminal domain-containing protein [Bacteroidales bacterium]
MKNVVSVLVVSLLFVTMVSCSSVSKNEESIELDGKYVGVLPCASCPGIETTFNFSANGTLLKSTNYIDNGVVDVDLPGYWHVEDDSIICISWQVKAPMEYYKQTSDSTIVMLSSDKSEITGELAPFYVLRKQ